MPWMNLFMAQAPQSPDVPSRPAVPLLPGVGHGFYSTICPWALPNPLQDLGMATPGKNRALRVAHKTGFSWFLHSIQHDSANPRSGQFGWSHIRHILIMGYHIPKFQSSRHQHRYQRGKATPQKKASDQQWSITIHQRVWESNKSYCSTALRRNQPIHPNTAPECSRKRRILSVYSGRWLARPRFRKHTKQSSHLIKPTVLDAKMNKSNT